MVLNIGSSNDCLEELALKDDLGWSMNILSLNAELVDELSVVFLILNFVFLTEIVLIVNVLHHTLNVIVTACLAIDSVNQVEFADFVRTEKGEMVLLSLVVDSVELGEGGVESWDLAISEETPNLTQSHCERLFTLGGLDLAGVLVVPGLELRVVAEHDVLNFLLNIGWVLLVFG